MTPKQIARATGDSYQVTLQKLRKARREVFSISVDGARVLTETEASYYHEGPVIEIHLKMKRPPRITFWRPQVTTTITWKAETL